MFRRPSPRIPGLFGLLLAACIACCFSPGTGFAQQSGPNPRIVETQCRNCHADRFAELAGNPHRILGDPDWIERTAAQPVCVTCHGDVLEHIRSNGDAGTVFAFGAATPRATNDVCLGCHASTHPEFDRSPHAKAGLACTDCHRQHGAESSHALLDLAAAVSARLDRVGDSSRLCAGCHTDILAAFDLNERHRLLEGALDCTSCHDPHAPAERTSLGGFRQETCINCHTEKGGPFVFEHPASRVEGCTACHSPHGSPNRHLLSHQRVAEVCISCHAVIPQFHVGFNPAAPSRFGLDTQCTNCHSSIHGSNFDPRFLR